MSSAVHGGFATDKCAERPFLASGGGALVVVLASPGLRAKCRRCWRALMSGRAVARWLAERPGSARGRLGRWGPAASRAVGSAVGRLPGVGEGVPAGEVRWSVQDGAGGDRGTGGGEVRRRVVGVLPAHFGDLEGVPGR